MSDFSGIYGVTRSLRTLLQDHISNDSRFRIAGQSVSIELGSPDEVSVSQNAVSLWLYRVSRNADLLNSPLERLDDDEIARAAIPIDLYYLITPRSAAVDTFQTLLGRILQVLNDHPILRGSALQSPLEPNEELRISLEPMTLEDLTRLWNSLDEVYQASLVYCVQLVRIESDLEPIRTRPVLERRSAFEQILEGR